jgi:4-diphosphocytidyl-2-C-methyl-D-erythritol kinase
MIKIKAPAKINLTLEVLGKRPDGYHDIKSVVQEISLADELEFSPAAGMSYTSDSPEWAGDKSLVSRAAALLKTRYGVEEGAKVRVTKRIPLRSGLGGDSSCAAAALKGFNRLWRLGLGVGQLMELAAELGSDVPFFLMGGTALIEGRGEMVTLLGPFPACWAVIVVPDVNVDDDKTGRLYRSLSPGDFTDGRRTEELVAALVENRPVEPHMLGNAFERVAAVVWPDIEEYRWQMMKAGADRVYLSGAGPALFSLFNKRTKAEKIYAELKTGGNEVYFIGLGNANK